MTEIDNPQGLDDVFDALANKHRREIIRFLGLHPCSISQLAALRDLSLPAIHKHIKLLDSAGMIRRKKIGRSNYLSLNRESLLGLQEWVMQYHPYRGSDEQTLENYAQYLSRQKTKIEEFGVEMKKFVFLTFGFEPPTDEIMDAWNSWFESIGDKLVDAGNPFGAGREVTRDGTIELSLDSGAITGYAIINAENMDEAENIAKGCPIITSIRVYEAMAM